MRWLVAITVLSTRMHSSRFHAASTACGWHSKTPQALRCISTSTRRRKPVAQQHSTLHDERSRVAPRLGLGQVVAVEGKHAKMP
jgi:hypothetical protein